MTTFVLPGQPLSSTEAGASFLAGSNTFSRGGSVYSTIVGRASNTAGVLSVSGKDDSQTIPEPDSLVR